MKKLLYVFLIGTMISFAGCSKKDEMVDYIPTLTDVSEGQDIDGTKEENVEEELSGEEDDSNAVIDTGIRTTKYVRLGDFGAVLNIRTEPSKEGQATGYLVHAEKVEVIDIKDGWASIVKGNDIRYVSADFLVDVRPEALSPPPTPEPTPEPTPTPKEEPKPTKAPEPTVAPEPKPTKKPKPTKAPKPTEAPEATEEPEVDDGV